MNTYLRELTSAARKLQKARAALQVAYEDAMLAAVAAADGGVTEVDIARTLGVNRMTVRKWRGKR